ncbi:hypothetical protein EXIGLDRAFT_721425 [Exidia glandulosa HHB12029]|uniref:Uncharacterized protein n=1 Tax=Exidia glandulosa HHB12029 TaxID=1314781 RepID=A0A165FRB1_EXIGL|nr:hypothetical protein EXIGLDRAFT_721425 [Exidia glandulosa HHB12029]
MPADVFVAATGPGTKKRKSKGDGEEGDAKRRRVGLEHDESDDDEPLATQLRALLVTEPDGDEDGIAYSDNAKDTDYSPTQAADSEDEELNIAYEDEDDIDYAPSPSRSPSVVTTSSTAVVTPELEQEKLPDSSKPIATGPTAADERLDSAEQRVKTSPPSSKARSVTASSTAVVTPEHEQEQDSSKPNAADERLLDIGIRVKTLERKLDAALNVIRQSEVLRAEWIGRMSESADADELEEEWNAGTAIETTTMTEEEDEPDDWSLWVMGAL